MRTLTPVVGKSKAELIRDDLKCGISQSLEQGKEPEHEGRAVLVPQDHHSLTMWITHRNPLDVTDG